MLDTVRWRKNWKYRFSSRLLKAGSVTRRGNSPSALSDPEKGLSCLEADWLAACKSLLENGRVLYPSHFRPVDRHRRHSGFSSSHFTLRILLMSMGWLLNTGNLTEGLPAGHTSTLNALDACRASHTHGLGFQWHSGRWILVSRLVYEAIRVPSYPGSDQPQMPARPDTPCYLHAGHGGVAYVKAYTSRLWVGDQVENAVKVLGTNTGAAKRLSARPRSL